LEHTILAEAQKPFFLNFMSYLITLRSSMLHNVMRCTF